MGKVVGVPVGGIAHHRDQRGESAVAKVRSRQGPSEACQRFSSSPVARSAFPTSSARTPTSRRCSGAALTGCSATDCPWRRSATATAALTSASASTKHRRGLVRYEGIPFDDPADTRARLIDLLAGWDSRFTTLIAACDDAVVPQSITTLPVGLTWPSTSDVTLLDAS